MKMNNRALVQAFEQAGLLFLAENGGGAGLRFERAKLGPEEHGPGKADV